MTLPFVKCDPYNFVPVTRTPWAGELIVATKKNGLPLPPQGWPDRVGESWEISTDQQFPSQIIIPNSTQLESNRRDELLADSKGQLFLSTLLKSAPEKYLGPHIASRFGDHCPLLLKWISANEPLSVQVHPHHGHPRLKSNECGKPESWLVLSSVPKTGLIYLGFKEGLSQSEIIAALRRDEPQDAMHVVYPEEGDYISIPTGCVHATGPGVLIAEPQYILPQKLGKTWRISDWARRYNAEGRQDPQGQPRELHLEDALTAIDWNLPRGKELEKILIHKLPQGGSFGGDKHNPFPVQIFSKVGHATYLPLIPNQFSLVTCWEGQLTLTSISREFSGHSLHLRAGESGFISAQANEIHLALTESSSGKHPRCAFFAFAETIS